MEGDLISSLEHKTVLVSSENLLFINFKRYYFYLSLLLVISSKKQSPGKNLEHYYLGLVSVSYKCDPKLQIWKTYDNHCSDNLNPYMRFHYCGISYVGSSYQLVRKTLDTTYKIVVSRLYVHFLNVLSSDNLLRMSLDNGYKIMYFTCVSFHMYFQITFLCEILWTLITFIGFLICVYFQVSF